MSPVFEVTDYNKVIVLQKLTKFYINHLIILQYCRIQIIKLFFDRCKYDITNFFVDEVFPKYKESKEYETFLRWKCKEKEPVVEDDFISMRILGRGGFGEVYAYQVICGINVFLAFLQEIFNLQTGIRRKVVVLHNNFV